MIKVTVKTLDSQNHEFSVDDNCTVEEFKHIIEPKVNIPADRQRIIYCGKVLQDSTKLKDHDLDGKVVHLVQRAPPNATRNRSLTPPPDPSRHRGAFRGFDRVGNTVYMGMGSMTFPQNLMDPQQMIPPRATHTLSASRLNVARRMLRSAENVIRQLENPSGTNEQPTPEEPVEEEMTPVIEARVIVPTNEDQTIDENAIVHAVENSIFSHTDGIDPTPGPSTSDNMQTSNVMNQSQSASASPAASTPRSASAENLTTENNSESQRGGNSQQPRTRCRGTEMAELLTTLNQLQTRFAPFLARYQSFMQDDPQIAQEDVTHTRQMLTRVSQVLHFLGHAYHSLSDIMINVDQAPPRLLLCRPILIQHSAVVQAGIPIQVEAQINLSADRPDASTNSSSTSTSTFSTVTSSSSNNTSMPSSTTNTPTNGSTPSVGPSITLQPGFVGLPFMPTGSMRVITTPVEIRTVRANIPRAAHPPNNNNNMSSSTPASTPPSAAPSSNDTRPADTATSTSGNSQPTPASSGQGQTGQGPPGQSNNGNLEFFMEVTPEGITIDSLETQLLGSNNQTANDLLRNGNLIQSLIQLIGSQLGGGLGQSPSQPAQRQATTTAESSQPSQQNNAQAQNNSQSQARGNTQTNPTTATHTRSTSRPHVHMTQQAVQGGFDPFLPCYSHHVANSQGPRIVSIGHSGRRESRVNREASASRDQTPNSTTPRPHQGGTPSAPPNLPNLAAQFDNIMGVLPPTMDNLGNQQAAHMVADSIMNAVRSFRLQTSLGAHQGRPQRGAPDGQAVPPPTQRPQQRSQQDAFHLLGALMGGGNFPDLLANGPTLDEFLQSLNPDPYVPGESLIIDLIMLLLRSLRLNDLLTLSSGNMAPLHRQMSTIQGFFRTEICQNDTSDSGINMATERIMNDFRPLITALESIPPTDGIDMVRTIDGFFRQTLPAIIRMAIHPDQREGANFLATIWRTAKELLALALHCSANGVQGVETVLEEAMFSMIFNQSNMPTDIHNWTIANSRTALRTIIRNLDVLPAEVHRYVIRREPVAETVESQITEASNSQNTVDESMEVEYASSPTEAEQVLDTLPLRVEDTEPLPNVIWGSEPWHRQTPEDWVPIITRDVQKQRRQNAQQPFSDAYLSGMPSKRRKIINNAKPQGSLPQVISESVRQAVTATGLTSAAPLETVAQVAGQSTEVITAYRTLLQSTVRANLRDNEDFTPERFPNAAEYFNGSPPE